MNLLRLIKKILELSSPEVRRMLKNSILAFVRAAEETPNLWDDVLAALLKAIFVGGDEDSEKTG